MAEQRLFISHASEDAAVADKIVAYLEARGAPCWISSRDIPPRAIYAEEITKGIQECGACAVILSKASNASAAVKRELELASHHGKPFIPIRIDATEPGPGVDYYLRNTQWIDYKRDGDPALNRIISVETRTPPPSTIRKRVTTIRWLFAAIASVAVVSLVAFLVNSTAPPRESEAVLSRDTPPDAEVISLNIHFAEQSFWLGESANAIASAAQERGRPPVAAAIAPSCGNSLDEQRVTAVFTALRRGGLQPYQIYSTECSDDRNVVLVALDWQRETVDGLRGQFVGRWHKVSGVACVAQTFEFGTGDSGFYWAARDEGGLRNQAVGSALRVGPHRIQIGSESAASSWAFEISNTHLLVFDLDGDSQTPICEYARPINASDH